MEADISILRKTGHFYFALTRNVTARELSTGKRTTRTSGLLLHISGCQSRISTRDHDDAVEKKRFHHDLPFNTRIAYYWFCGYNL